MGVKWFGESWGAPVCEPETRVPTPVGERCLRCDGPVREGDSGVATPIVAWGMEIERPYHRMCFLAHLGVAVVHVLEGGFPLCGFDNGTPSTWPEPQRNLWVRRSEAARASCPECRAKAGVA